MKPATLNYRYVHNREKMSSTNGFEIEARREVCWTSMEPNNKNHQVSVSVAGVVEGEERPRKIKWSFQWPDENLKALEAAIAGLMSLVENRPVGGKFIEHEAFADVYPWLRVGLILEGSVEKQSAYIEFRQDGTTVRTLVGNIGELMKFRSKLYPLFN